MQLQLTSRHTQQGVTLIEVLVSVLLLSIGLLGMMGMQVGVFRFERGASDRAVVTAALADMAETIRMLPSTDASQPPTDFRAVQTYAAEIAAKGSGYADPSVDCANATCTRGEFAQYQLTRWRQALDRALPGAVGFVDVDTNYTFDDLRLSYTIIVAWRDKTLVDLSNTPIKAPICEDIDQTGLTASNCCPKAISAPEGVRCVQRQVLP
ncbi:MAG: hypothetical protein OHK0048_05000 [Rhodoferax sp.]